MPLTIDRMNLLQTAMELNKAEVEIIDGLFAAQSYKSVSLIAQPENMGCFPTHGNQKMKDPNNAGQSTPQIPKPSNLAGISTFDFAELKNYIYGVNGRY
jgi:hypothetical protein